MGESVDGERPLCIVHARSEAAAEAAARAVRAAYTIGAKPARSGQLILERIGANA
jgi:thymidine phosphorylase